MTDKYTQLSDYLKELLKRRGWSQRTLAMYANVSHDTISRMTRGKGPYDVETLERVATALGADADHLKQLAGIIHNRSILISDPAVLDLAHAIDILPEQTRQALIPSIRQVVWAMIEAYQTASLVEEAKTARPDLAERAEQLKQERKTKADKIESA